jgi:broad specificity phosphatase PhoE
MKNECYFYIVRHGETEWNVKRIVQGHKDSALTHEGKRQAHLLKVHFRKISFAAVYSSDLLRAKKTAQIINWEKKLAITTTKALRERSFGYLEGKTFSQIKEDFAKLIPRYQKESQLQAGKNGLARIESDEEMTSRTFTFLRELSLLHQGKKVLLVTHGGLLRTLLIHLGYFTLEESPKYKIKNTAYIILAGDGVSFTIKQISGIKKIRP